METNQDPGKPTTKKLHRPAVYFAIAWILAALLALAWAVDKSFVYILLGASSFFFFLGFRSRAEGGSVEREKYNPYKNYRKEHRTASLQSPFWREIVTLFSRKHAGFQAGKFSGPSETPAERKLVLGVVTFIVSIFGLIIMIILFSDPDTMPEADYYFSRAEENYTAGVYDSAYINYKRALQENPGHLDALLGYGNTLSALGQPDSAIILYDQALAIDPDFDIARYNKGWVHYNRKNYSQSVIELKALLEKNPSYFDAMQLLGDVYYGQNVYEEALGWYESAYANGLRSRWLCHVMAYLYDLRGDIPKAIALYQEALAYDSTVTEIYTRLGELIPGEGGKVYRDRSGN
jgi:tetratricopeptide (TPR) repeat protein